MLLITSSLFTTVMLKYLSPYCVMPSNPCTVFNAWLVTATPLRQGCLYTMRKAGLLLYRSLHQMKGQRGCFMLAGVSQQVILKHLESREILLVSVPTKFFWIIEKKEKGKRNQNSISLLSVSTDMEKNEKGNFKETKNCFMLLILKEKEKSFETTIWPTLTPTFDCYFVVVVNRDSKTPIAKLSKGFLD